jgi:hypothetical protein
MKRILLALCLLVMTTQAWSQVPQYAQILPPSSVAGPVPPPLASI